ncbi:ubiquinol--cytochrome-c reductase subunit 6 [Tieghemiomyces parasiticus]|uniref:Ubiquinol--cytochrome-c reductase subunit 6 n=1 Tax=Tieghemiomyces parasiticus TaxID=78921 RepID=A0A9W7ZLN2_9FUNG|nr:ubiquinol--cytochrome-c reductase subunit 6 [Tieghemiomyces parasiticus]KAJ1923691.1 ubiquinol--cytochrome-c reductase subunit 6 [Tieghemiomyces parasiticus]
MTLFEYIKTTMFATLHADAEQPEPVVVEEETEAEEVEDTMPVIQEACSETASCKPLKKHLEECTARVENGSHENCVEEFFHLQHCVDDCAAPKIFATLK